MEGKIESNWWISRECFHFLEMYTDMLAGPFISFSLTLSSKCLGTLTILIPQQPMHRLTLNVIYIIKISNKLKIRHQNYQYCLQVLKIYGKKQAQLTWALHIKKSFLSVGFAKKVLLTTAPLSVTVHFSQYVLTMIFSWIPPMQLLTYASRS